MRSDKKGALEMSIGTIVVIVLAMSMLILGMVLMKNIFSGSSQNILQMNDQVKDQINKLFTEDKRSVVNLPNQIAKIKQDEDWGVAFAITNLVKGPDGDGNFHYEVELANSDEAQQNCGISSNEIESWIKTGRASDITIPAGNTYFGIIRFFIPDTAPLCTVRLNIVMTKDGNSYATDFFDVEVLP